jgi:hypothetical protein
MYPTPDSAVLVSDLQNANKKKLLLFITTVVHLLSQSLRSHKIVEIMVYLNFFAYISLLS